MPHKPYWFRDLDTITHSTRAMQEPVLSRYAIQRLFNISQTEAGRLMRRIGCVYVGHAKAVLRPHLLEWLRQVKRDGGYEMEMKRIERLEVKLQADKPVLFLPAAAKPVRAAVDLPENILLTSGRLVIQFDGAVGLLSALQSISEAAARDWPGFQQACGGTK